MNRTLIRMIGLMMLVPLLTFLIVGLIVFAWPIFVVAAAVAILSFVFSIFNRRRKAFA